MSRGCEIGIGRFENIGHVFLRVAIDVGKHRALNVDHDPVPFLERVANRLKWQINRRDFVGYEGLGRLKALTEPTPHDLTADHLLVTAKIQSPL